MLVYVSLVASTKSTVAQFFVPCPKDCCSAAIDCTLSVYCLFPCFLALFDGLEFPASIYPQCRGDVYWALFVGPVFSISIHYIPRVGVMCVVFWLLVLADTNGDFYPLYDGSHRVWVVRWFFYGHLVEKSAAFASVSIQTGPVYEKLADHLVSPFFKVTFLACFGLASTHLSLQVIEGLVVCLFIPASHFIGFWIHSPSQTWQPQICTLLIIVRWCGYCWRLGSGFFLYFRCLFFIYPQDDI